MEAAGEACGVSEHVGEHPIFQKIFMCCGGPGAIFGLIQRFFIRSYWWTPGPWPTVSCSVGVQEIDTTPFTRGFYGCSANLCGGFLWYRHHVRYPGIQAHFLYFLDLSCLSDH